MTLYQLFKSIPHAQIREKAQTQKNTQVYETLDLIKKEQERLSGDNRGLAEDLAQSRQRITQLEDANRLRTSVNDLTAVGSMGLMAMGFLASYRNHRALPATVGFVVSLQALGINNTIASALIEERDNPGRNPSRDAPQE